MESTTMKIRSLLLGAVALTAIVGNARAASIIELAASIPACRNIEDTREIRLIEARTQNGFAETTAYGRALVNQYIDDKRLKLPDGGVVAACQWLRAGEVRYVAERRSTGEIGFVAGRGIGPAAYLCMGELIAGTNQKDTSKPRLWVYMADSVLRAD